MIQMRVNCVCLDVSNIKLLSIFQVSKEEFRLMSRQIMPASEVGPFVNNVYAMFDSNDDGRLDFEEFVMATSGRETGASHVDKMLWLFENVYDKVK